MDAKNKAFRASLEQTEARTAKVVAEQKRQSKEIPLTTFEGIDAESGRAKQITNLDCGGEAIAVGEIISGGSFKMGSPVMARGTEGSTRLDGKSSMALSLDCGSGGAPNPRIVNDIPDPDEPPPDPDDEEEVEKEDIEDELKNQDEPPDCGAEAGRIVPFSLRIIGFAKVYRVYTGEVKQDKNGLFYCETEERIEENADEAKDNKNDTGCVSPEEAAGAAPLKRCQWFNATQIQALNFFGCPDGMTCTGFVEYPSGQYRILCCTLDDSPAPVQGIGAEWRPENVAETGSAAVDVDYCSSARASMTWGESGEAYSENPPVSFSVSGETVTISDSIGAIATVPLDEVLGEGVSQEAAPDTDYCDGKAKAVLTWDGGGRIETLNPPISYSLSPPGAVQLFGTNTTTICSRVLGVGCVPPGTPFIALHRYPPSALPHCSAFQNPDEGVPFVIPSGIVGQARNLNGSITANFQAGDTIIVHRYNDYVLGSGFIEGRISVYRNGSPLSLNRVLGYLNIFQQLDSWEITVSDSTGIIGTFSSTLEPTGFGVTCYDYAIAYQCRNKPICS